MGVRSPLSEGRNRTAAPHRAARCAAVLAPPFPLGTPHTLRHTRGAMGEHARSILTSFRASWYFGRYVMARSANGCRAPHVRHPRPPMGRGRGPVPVGTHPSKEVCQSTNYSSQTTRSRPPPSSPPPPPRSTRRHLGRRARNCCHHSRLAPHSPHVLVLLPAQRPGTRRSGGPVR